MTLPKALQQTDRTDHAMSCSKFDMPTPPVRVKNPLAAHKMIVGMKTHLEHGYTYRLEAFSIKETDDHTTFYLMQIFDTTNKKGDSRTASVSLWKVLNGFECIESFMVADTEHMMDNGRRIREIKCPVAQETMLAMPRCKVAALFTTNDVECMDSFTYSRPPSTPRCIEHSVMCMAKTRFALAHVKEMPADKLFELYLTSRFMDADTIQDIIKGLGNDDRFKSRAPKDLSEQELKAYKTESLKVVREHMKANVKPEDFKPMVVEWLEHNLVISRTLDPAVYKDAIGRKVPMTAETAKEWDRLSGLLFLMATSKHYRESRCDLQLAMSSAFNGTWIAEITPKDQRWGVSPPDGQDLKWVCSTPAGRMWLLHKLVESGSSQEMFVDALKEILAKKELPPKAKLDMAMGMLTDGLNQYEHGILGLTKSIFLRTLTGELQLPVTLKRRMENEVNKYGIDWWLCNVDVEHVKKEDDRTTMDPFRLLESVAAKPV
jgi:hypothetical protein